MFLMIEEFNGLLFLMFEEFDGSFLIRTFLLERDCVKLQDVNCYLTSFLEFNFIPLVPKRPARATLCK